MQGTGFCVCRNATVILQREVPGKVECLAIIDDIYFCRGNCKYMFPPFSISIKEVPWKSNAQILWMSIVKKQQYDGVFSIEGHMRMRRTQNTTLSVKKDWKIVPVLMCCFEQISSRAVWIESVPASDFQNWRKIKCGWKNQPCTSEKDLRLKAD